MQNLEAIGDAAFEILKETFSINSNRCQAKFLTSAKFQTYHYIIIIMIFYCGLVVHITDTRAQKVVSYTHQRTLQKRRLHMTNTGRNKAVYVADPGARSEHMGALKLFFLKLELFSCNIFLHRALLLSQ